MEKFFIQNRDGKKISVLVEQSPEQKGLAFVMHGLGGFKESPHISAFAQAFKVSGFTVIRFDCRDTIGESEGIMEDATVSGYYEDLEDVIIWAKKQEWYQEPFWLSGHSLGGICTVLYAEQHPEKVKGLAPVSTVVSGQLSYECYEVQDLKNWKETGWQIKESASKPGVMKRLKWTHMEDRLKFDLLPKANKLTMPALLIVGENDVDTPLKHQQILYEALPGKKELHVIKGAPHTFRDSQHLEEIKQIFTEWIQSNL